MKRPVIVYPFPMNLTQGFTYHLSILQSAISLARLTKVFLLVLDSEQDIQRMVSKELGESLPEALTVIQVRNRKFGVKSNRVWFYSSVVKFLAKIVSSQGYAVIYTRNVKLAAYVFPRLKRSNGVHCVFESHQLYSQNLACELEFRRAQRELVLERKLYGSADLVFVNTTPLANLITRFFSCKSVVLPVAVRSQDLLLNKDSNSLPGFVAEKQYDFVYAGTYSAWKGVDTVVEAIRLLAGEGWSGNCLFLGLSESSVDEWRRVVDIAGLGGHIELVSRVERQLVPSYLDKCRVGLVPNSLMGDSIFNTSPLKIFDYAARGLYLVLPQLPALQSEIDLSDVEWFVPDNPVSLKGAMKRALSDCDGFSQRNVNWAENHTWEKRAAKILSEFQLLGEVKK